MKRPRLAHLLVAAAIVTAAIAALLVVKPSSRETGMASAAAQSMRLASSNLLQAGFAGNGPRSPPRTWSSPIAS